jgi:hypothetical protein
VSTSEAGDRSDADSGSVRERLGGVVRAVDSPTNWALVRADDAETKWRNLRVWVEWFRREFGFDHRVVPSCWYLHPALVSVLSALRDQWCLAYDPLNMLTAPSAWHVTLLQLEPRLREFCSRTGCTTAEHRADARAEYPDDTQQWTAHVTADVAVRRNRERAAPIQQRHAAGRRDDRDD